ncbi:hypothetical protein BGX30_012576 [Mortierella sp. GBA39]|nr:hypothetical protein BGX30_012576 [Mortierella sp. GBA39]
MEAQHFSNRQLETPPASPLPEGVEEAFGSEQEGFEQEEVEYEQHACEQEEYEEEGYQGEGEDNKKTAYEEEYEEGKEEEGLYNWGDDLELTLPGEYYSGYRRILSCMLRPGCTIRVKYGRDGRTLGYQVYSDDCREQVQQRRRKVKEFERQKRQQEREFERLPQPPRSQPPPPHPVQECRPALYYHNHAPCRDFSDEPIWNQTEPIPMSVEEQEEDRRWMKYYQKNLQDMDRKMEDELMHYVALAEKQPRYPQEPLRVSMVHVDSGHPSTSQLGGHVEVNSSSGSQNLPPSAYISDSEKPFPWSDDEEEEAEESAEEQGRAMSSIERSLRAQAVTALHNPSAMLLHSVSMNETPTRTRLRMYRHLTGQPQPPHEYAPESVKQAYGESGGKPLDDHSHYPHHHHTDTHASSSSSSSHTAAASEHYQHLNHHSHGHHHHHHHMDSPSSHVDDDVPIDDEFGPTYFQGALND